MHKNKYFAFVLVGILMWSSCSGEQSIESMNDEALTLFGKNKIDQAIEVSEKMLEKARNVYAQDDEKLTGILEQLGLFYTKAGDLIAAEQRYKEALEISISARGEKSEKTAKIMNNLAGIYMAIGDKEKAASLYEKTLSITRGLFPPDDPRLETIQSNLRSCRTGNIETDKYKSESSTVQASGPRDLVPESIKQYAIQNFAKEHIQIINMRPETAVPVTAKGIVFPYVCTIAEQKGTEKKAVMIFAAVRTDGKKISFRQTRIVSYDSYQSDLKDGGIAKLRKEFIRLFPKVFS